MQCDNSDKSYQEWPTLNDVVNRRNVADGRVEKNMRNTTTENGVDHAAGYASSTENEGSNANNSAKTGKKNSSKRNNWTRLPINPPPYRQRGNGRRYNDSTRPFENGQNNHNGNNYSNGFVNGRGNSRSRGTRGNRGRGFLYNRPRREVPAVDPENTPSTSETTGHCINGVVFYSSSSQYKNICTDDLKKNIKHQIEYYFSEENLSTDIYIRRKMDSQGYVPLSLIATFNRMRKLTNDMDLIVEAVRESSKLELCDDYLVRPVVDPLRWPASYCPKAMPPLRTDVPEFFPGQPYINMNPIIEQMGNLQLNGTIYPALQVPYPPSSMENVNGFSELVLGVTSPLEQDSNIMNHYVDSPATLGVDTEQVNGLDHYPDDQTVINGFNYCPNGSSPVQQISGFDYFTQPVDNDVVYYKNNQQSNDGGCYSVLSSAENLPNGVDTSDDQTLHNKSPEPAR